MPRSRLALLLAVLAGLVAGTVVAVLAGRDGAATAQSPATAAVSAADDPGAPRAAPAGDPRRPSTGPARRPPSGPGFVRLRAAGPVRVEVRARDPRGGPDWVVRTFRAERVVPPAGRRPGVDPVIGRPLCAQLGRELRGRFGWIDATNTFRPVGMDSRGAPTLCGSRRADTGGRPLADTLTRITDPRAGAARALQTVTWGLAGRGARTRVTVRGRAIDAPRTASGAFLVLAPADLRTTEPAVLVRYPSRRAVRLGEAWRRGARRFAADMRRLPGGYRRMPLPATGGRATVELRTPDPHGGLPWGIAAAPAEGGGWCLSDRGRIVGDRVGFVDHALGTLKDGRYDPNDACGGNGRPRTRREPLSIQSSGGGAFAGEPGFDPEAGRTARRTLPGLTTYSGRAHPDVVEITIETPRDVRTLLPSRRARAFLAVYDGSFPTGEVVLTARLRDGRTVREVLPSSAF